MTRPPKDIAASVKQRLLNLARSSGADFNGLLVRYGIERFLYRLSRSQHSNDMILKGALLFVLWRPTAHRPTRDLDLLGFGEPSPESVAKRVREVLAAKVEDDGLVFDESSIEAVRIREDQEYQGVRVTLACSLGKARIDLQIDVGYGDALTEPAEPIEYPSLLGFPAPVIRAYSRATVVAEKLHAMVTLGLANSRMKDFYDLTVLAREFGFDRAKLDAAIRATFGRRGTPMPESLPLALSDEFGSDLTKQSAPAPAPALSLRSTRAPNSPPRPTRARPAPPSASTPPTARRPAPCSWTTTVSSVSAPQLRRFRST